MFNKNYLVRFVILCFLTISIFGSSLEVNNEIPSSVLEKIRTQAKLVFPHDADAQWFVILYLQKVYIDIKQFTVEDVPPEIIGQIKMDTKL